jgi:hypothetical protein
MRSYNARFVVSVFLLTMALAFTSTVGGDLEVPHAVFNEGGGQRMCVGCRFSISNDAIGDSVSGRMTSSSGRFTVEPYSSAMKPFYPPPEPHDLHVSTADDKDKITWDIIDPGQYAERFTLYREESEVVGWLPPLVFDCFDDQLAGPPGNDLAIPPEGKCFVYLITSANAYYESTLGSDSFGNPRLKGLPCP